MLVLSRKQQETVVIDGRIRVTIVKAGGRTVRLGIEAPGDIAILRGEVFQRLQTVPPSGRMDGVPVSTVQADSRSLRHAPNDSPDADGSC